ncbi:hypothetical protein NW765_017592 [Fusarium oxysporum]|nr:hypothetical protein NW765_017592 [Fusarium oxysporum]KAJ4263749.1 hypothetical protein NW764_016045 [Fusarium oxysporum]
MSNSNFFEFRNVINGTLRGSERLGHGINPSTRSPLWDAPLASSQDLEDAVGAAHVAFTEWSKRPWKQRQASLAHASRLLTERKSDMARLLSTECGKPPQFAELEVIDAISFLDFFAAQEPLEARVIQDDKDLCLTLQYEPMGVIGAICPWNYPLVLAIGKIAPALLAGNSIIAKPSPYTPYSLLKFAEIVQDVFPPGVLQALHGDVELGPMLCQHPDVDKISFTGSSATGKKIMAAASATLKSVTLELGGNSASIICPDIDIDAVAPQVALASFFNSGQLCVASKRVYVHEDIYDRFLEKMVETVQKWKVGPPDAEGVMLGPVQNEMQYGIVKRFFEETTTSGYRFACGGGQKLDGLSLFINPAIIDNPPDQSLVVEGEAFGPIVPLLKWKNEHEVLARANNTKTGLGGAVWSSDLERARRIAAGINSGTVWINSAERPLPQAHLAGRKESGVGGEWGREGLTAYCNVKTIHHYKHSVSRN